MFIVYNSIKRDIIQSEKPHPLSVGFYGFQRGLEPLSCFGNHLTVTWAWGVDFMIRWHVCVCACGLPKKMSIYNMIRGKAAALLSLPPSASSPAYSPPVNVNADSIVSRWADQPYPTPISPSTVHRSNKGILLHDRIINKLVESIYFQLRPQK